MRIAVIFIVASLVLAIGALNWPDGKVSEVTDTAGLPDSGKANPSPQTTAVKPAAAITLPQDTTVDSGDSAIREITIDAGSDYQETMNALGLGDLEDRYGKWLLSRGYAFSDHTGNYLLDQPYAQYDDDTLRAFADNEDMWAQQFLAERLEKTRPAEALDWYRKAAINGSVNAMNKIISLYSKIGVTRADNPGNGDTYKEQIYAIRDGLSSVDEMSYAWTVAAQQAGGDPSQNKSLISRLERNFDEATRERACQMAQGLYDDLKSARTQRGLGDFERSPPPFMLGSMDDLSSSPCSGASSEPSLDFSSCEEVNVVTSGIGSRVMVCKGGAG